MNALPPLISDYLSLKSPHTKRGYLVVIRDWLAFCSQDPEIAFRTCNTELALRYFASLRTRVLRDGTRLGDATISHRIAVLKALFQFLQDSEYRTGNPFALVRKAIPRSQANQKRPTALIPFAKVNEILALPDLRTKEGVRDLALLSIAFGGGLRRSEVLSLMLGSIKVGAEGVFYLELLRTKAGRKQEQPLPEWAWKHVNSLLVQRYSEGGSERSKLFVTYKNGGGIRDGMNESTLYRIYREYAHRVGIKAAPHSARATAATQLKMLGFEDREVAGFLRHSSTKQVEIYDKRFRELGENVGVKLSYPGIKDSFKKRRKSG